jgi:predicted double-glycine peptidase
MINLNDILYCIKEIPGLTYGKSYKVITLQKYNKDKSLSGVNLTKNDICIYNDDMMAHWFGQIGTFEPWTNWFVTEIQWKRNEKINQLI